MGRKKLHMVKLTGRVPPEIAEKYRQLARDTGFAKMAAAGEIVEIGALLAAIMTRTKDGELFAVINQCGLDSRDRLVSLLVLLFL